MPQAFPACPILSHDSYPAVSICQRFSPLLPYHDYSVQAIFQGFLAIHEQLIKVKEVNITTTVE
jgi:hypothetical protein